MDDLLARISAYVDANADRLVSELQAFLRQPSISTENIGMEECTAMLQQELSRLEMDNEILTVPGAFPAVYGTTPAKGPKKELFVYGHYDVQSPDPLDKWHYDPFGAEIHAGQIYARGATDDKGNLFANLKAAETLKAILGAVPAGLKFFFEGEEEIGSPNLEAYLSGYAEKLRADAAILCDRGVHESGRPQMYLGNKGILSVEIRANRAKRDVHSGHAPLIPNAIYDLVRLLESMRHPDGTIAIPGYYDQVTGPSPAEVACLRDIPFDPEQFRREYAIPAIIGGGEPLDMLTRLLSTPTCNISGIRGGWAGERSKTIIPCEAWVRLDMRLVKNQSIEEAKAKIAAFVAASPFGEFTVRFSGKNEPYQVSPQDELVQLAIGLSREIYGAPPVVWPLLDGSGPMNLFPACLGTECFIIGLGAPFSTANTHAPDENISIEQYLTGIKLMAAIYYRYLVE